MKKVYNGTFESEVEYYFNSLKPMRRLSDEEEMDLGLRIQNGDKRALSKLVEHNLLFVVNVAKAYRGKGVPFSELISEGNLGLIHAAEKFDPTKKIRFISYAVWWIKCYIQNIIKEQHETPEISNEDYMDYNYKDEEISYTFEEDVNNSNDRVVTVSNLMKCLNEREFNIIKMSFGLGDDNDMTLEEISLITKLSIERVRQIKDAALVKLKCNALMSSSDIFNEMKFLS